MARADRPTNVSGTKRIHRRVIMFGFLGAAVLVLGLTGTGRVTEPTITFTNPVFSNRGPDAPLDYDYVDPLGRAASAKVPPPGVRTANPRFVENGFSVEAFWAINTGQRDGHYIRGHFHPTDLATGFEAQHFGWSTELHGLFVRAVDGRQFSLKSLRYRVTANRQGQNRSVDGFTIHNVNILISTSFRPTGSVLGQFIWYPVGPPIGNDPTLPFLTLPINEFDFVTQVFIASSASVDFDDIVLVVH